MVGWRKHFTAGEQGGEEPFDENDENSPLAGYGYHREQDEEDASCAESEISKSLDTGRVKKKVGRKSYWKEEDITDMVDIVCNSDYYKERLSSRILKTGKTTTYTSSC